MHGCSNGTHDFWMGIRDSIKPLPIRNLGTREAKAPQQLLRSDSCTPLGIVYATDAKVEPRVKIVGTFPADSHPEIVYPVAAAVTAKPEADTYLRYLRSAAAKAVFKHYGFASLVPPGS